MASPLELPPSPLAVLIVDDDPMFRRLVRRLMPTRCDFVECASIAEAVEQLVTARVGGVICDVHMPGGNGVELLEWLESHRPDLLPRTVFMSGDADSDDARRLTQRSVPVVPKTSARTLREGLVAAVPPARDDGGE